MDSLPPNSDLSQYPAGSPPPGVTPNFIDPPSLSWAGRVAIYTSLPVMLSFFVLRLYVRLFVLRSFGLDDCMCIIATASTISLCGVLLPQFLDDTWGRHIWDIPLLLLIDNPDFLKRIVITGVLYNVAAVFVKLTFLTLYLRIFQPIWRLRLSIWAGVVGITAIHVVVTILTLEFCIPHRGEGGWGSPKYNERCGTNYLKLTTAQGVLSSLTDIYVLILPIPVLMGINFTRWRKIGVVGIFLAGFLATIFSIVGVVYRFEDVFSSPPDYTWYSMWLQPLGVAEINVGVICSCMPIIFVLFRDRSRGLQSPWLYLKKYLGSRTERNTQASVESESKVSTSRAGPRAKWQRAPATETLGSTYLELSSIYDGNHSQIGDRQGATERPQHG